MYVKYFLIDIHKYYLLIEEITLNFCSDTEMVEENVSKMYII